MTTDHSEAQPKPILRSNDLRATSTVVATVGRHCEFGHGDTPTALFAALRSADVSAKATPTISFSIGEEELQHMDAATMDGNDATWNYLQTIESTENQAFVERFRAQFGDEFVVTAP